MHGITVIKFYFCYRKKCIEYLFLHQNRFWSQNVISNKLIALLLYWTRVKGLTEFGYNCWEIRQECSFEAYSAKKGLMMKLKSNSKWAGARQSNKMTCARSEPSLSAWRKCGSLATHKHTKKTLWSGLADAQADLSLRWAHRSPWWFCRALAQIIIIQRYICTMNQNDLSTYDHNVLWFAKRRGINKRVFLHPNDLFYF